MMHKSIIPDIAGEIFQVLEATIEVILNEFEEIVTSGFHGALFYSLLGVFIGITDYIIFNFIGLSELGINSAEKIGNLSLLFILVSGVLCGIVFGLIRGLKEGAKKTLIGSRYIYRFFEYVVVYVVNNAKCAVGDKVRIIKTLKDHSEVFKSRIICSRILSGLYGNIPFIKGKIDKLQFAFVENTIDAFDKVAPDILNGVIYDNTEELARHMAEKIQERTDRLVASAINQIFYKSSIVSYLMVLVLFIIPLFLITII